MQSRLFWPRQLSICNQQCANVDVYTHLRTAFNTWSYSTVDKTWGHIMKIKRHLILHLYINLSELKCLLFFMHIQS